MLMTPVETHGGFLVKRDDLFEFAGVRGGKVRTCRELCFEASRLGVPGVVTAGARHSPQANIVARVGAAFGLRVRIHTAAGPETSETEAAAAAGAEIVRWTPGYNSVIIRRTQADAEAHHWKAIPFGMECREATVLTSFQVSNLPFGDFRRIVVPVGSGMSIAGILIGLEAVGPLAVPVLGIVVGADPRRRIDAYGPIFADWKYELRPAGIAYGREAPITRLGPDLELDPIYEAKCLPFLESGDLLWVVGRR